MIFGSSKVFQGLQIFELSEKFSCLESRAVWK